ncbi:MAG: PilZ domain-containing protein [Pseudomonadota bacterium]|nr:PilZ domain-containing protein [Pseudomonadota bacterium]MDO7711706.1 PilZ domain-containing protein [Pseudomonadota bacterium]
MANITIDERRNFSRIPFHALAHIHADKGELHLNCEVLDISLNGILIVKPDGWRGQLTDNYKIDLVLENAQLVIKMSAAVAHIDGGSIGFNCKNIDLDSISHLKRLVELNLGDEPLLHRELASLIQ